MKGSLCLPGYCSLFLEEGNRFRVVFELRRTGKTPVKTRKMRAHVRCRQPRLRQFVVCGSVCGVVSCLWSVVCGLLVCGLWSVVYFLGHDVRRRTESCSIVLQLFVTLWPLERIVPNVAELCAWGACLSLFLVALSISRHHYCRYA